MAGFYRYTAILDACVLYPAPLRDLLLTLAEASVFGARWTTLIQQEWMRNLLSNRPDLSQESLEKTVAAMNEAIDDSLVENYEYLIESLALPDPDDRHVLAAAVVGHADAIVTFNLKDFPQEYVSRHGIEILHPDDFLVAQYDLNQIKVLTAVKNIRAKLKKPPKTAEQLILIYEQQGLSRTGKLLRAAIELL